MSLDILPGSLRTNIRFIDEQHAQLLQIAEDIKNEAASNPDREKLEELVQFLSVYTETHFGEEEEMMEVFEYPDLENHKKEHNYFKYYIETVQHDIRNMNDLTQLSQDVIDSLKNWIVEHVKGTDIKMAKIINIPETYKKDNS